MKTRQLAAVVAALGGVVLVGVVSGPEGLRAAGALESGQAEEVPQRTEPWGVRLRWGSSATEAPLGIDVRMLTWGMTGDEVEAQLGENHYGDWRGEDRWLLGTQESGGWWADLGGGYRREYRATLFFIDGRFYRYFVDIPPSRFSLVAEALVNAIGEPTAQESSVVSNTMGAKFDQEIRVWDLDEVEVHLSKRASRVTTGLLSVTYKPLAADVPKASAKAPF